MTRLTKVLFTAASLVAMAGTALAQDPEGEEGGGAEGGGEGTEGGEGMPAEPEPGEDPGMAAPGAVPPLTLGKGKIMIAGSTVNVNMSADAVGKPISFAPSIWYGVSDKLTVGVTHDGGTTPWSPRPFPSLGICISGEENGCAKVYDNVGLDILFGIKDEKFSLAAHGGLIVKSFDPATLSLRVGALGRFMASDKLAVVFDPAIFIGLTERDGVDVMGVTVGGNKEEIDVPLWIWFMATPQLGVYGHAGITGPLDGFGDAYRIPIGLGGTFMVNEKLGVGADFHFLNLAGKNSSADLRALGIRVQYAL